MVLGDLCGRIIQPSQGGLYLQAEKWFSGARRLGWDSSTLTWTSPRKVVFAAELSLLNVERHHTKTVTMYISVMRAIKPGAHDTDLSWVGVTLSLTSSHYALLS